MKLDENKYLGTLCKRGHDFDGTGKSLRLKLNCACRACALRSARNSKRKHPHRYKEKQHGWYLENIEHVRRYNRNRDRAKTNESARLSRMKPLNKKKKLTTSRKPINVERRHKKNLYDALFLSDLYVGSLLKSHGNGLPVTPKTILIKRKQIMLKREISRTKGVLHGNH